jgi:hypothetical protein
MNIEDFYSMHLCTFLDSENGNIFKLELSKQIFKYLLSHTHINPNGSSIDDCLLFFASKNDNIDFVKILLEDERTDINLYDGSIIYCAGLEATKLLMNNKNFNICTNLNMQRFENLNYDINNIKYIEKMKFIFNYSGFWDIITSENVVMYLGSQSSTVVNSLLDYLLKCDKFDPTVDNEKLIITQMKIGNHHGVKLLLNSKRSNEALMNIILNVIDFIIN